MIREKFINKLRKKYQTGGVGMEGRYRNPLVDPYITIGGRNIQTDFGNRAAFGGKLSIPMLSDGGKYGYYKSLRGETDFAGRYGGREGIGELEAQLGPNHPAVRHGLPEYMNTEPKMVNASIGLRGIYNKNIGNLTMRSNIGAGVGSGDYAGEFYRYNPNLHLKGLGYGDIELSEGTAPGSTSAPVTPYVDANLGLMKRTEKVAGLPTTVGGNVSYGTKSAPNPGLRVGASGTLGPLSGNVGYDVTNNAFRAGVGLNFQTGGVKDLATSVGKKGLSRMLSSGLQNVGLRGASKAVAPLGILSTLYGMYKSGKEHSGNKFGQKKNPNYVEGSNESKFIKHNPFLTSNQYQAGGTKFDVGDSELEFFNTQGNPIPPAGSIIDGNIQKIFTDRSMDNLSSSDTLYYNIPTGAIDYYDPESGDRSNLVSKDEQEYPFGTKKPNAPYLGTRRQTGGVALPGGEMNPILGSDAVEFEGNTHDEGGILLDSQTEVENGETMDKVNINKKGGKRGGKKDYFFSSYLKMGGKSFADKHKEILANGGNQNDINMLAKMQEKIAGRDPNQVAGLGGVIKYKGGGFKNYQTGGVQEKPIFDIEKPQIKDFKNSLDYMKARKKWYQAKEQYEKDLQVWETAQTDTNIVNPSDSVIVNPTDTNTIIDDDEDPNYDEFDSEEFDAYLAEEERLENEEEKNRKDAEREKIVARSKELQKRAKAAGVDLEPFKGPGGGLLPSQLDSLESAINTKETEVKEKEQNLNNLKAQADELGIKYKDNVTAEILESRIKDAGYDIQAQGEGTYLKDVGGKGIPAKGKQGKITIGDKTYYMDDPELQEFIAAQGDDFGPNWMANLDQDVLDNAGITSFEDFQDTDNVRKYQVEYNKKYQDKQIGVDGKLGEETIRTGIIDSKVLPEVTVTDTKDTLETIPLPTRPIQPISNPIEEPEMKTVPYNFTEDNNISTEDTCTDCSCPEYAQANPQLCDKKPTQDFDTKVPWQAWAGMGAGLIPAAVSLFNKPPAAEQAKYTPGFSPVVAYRGRAPKLERYDYNQDIANVGRDVRAMNTYIESSGGGPANMVNKMAAFSKGQQAKDKIRAAETRANIGVANTEAQLEQQMELDNLRRQQQASIFNSQMNRAEMARKDQIDEANTARRQKRLEDIQYNKFQGWTSFAQSIQTGLGDVLDYKADMAKAKAIGAGTSVYMDAAKLNQGWTFADDGITLIPPTRKFGGLRRLKTNNR